MCPGDIGHDHVKITTMQEQHAGVYISVARLITWWCCIAGVSIVSPQWVLRSLKGGEAQRCLQISLDTVAHLPASASEQAGSIRASTSEQVVHSLPSAAPQTHGKLLALSITHHLPLGAAQTGDRPLQLHTSG